MKLCVVSPGSGWILDIIASSVARAACGLWLQIGDSAQSWVDATSANFQHPAEADVFLFWDVQNCWGEDWRVVAPNAIHVGAFTHLDLDMVRSFRPYWSELDGVVHMSRRYEKVFAEQGWYPKERMTVIPPFDRTPFRLKPLRLGVCQRGGFPGKGDPFLFTVLDGLAHYVAENVELHIKGSGWQPSYDGWRLKSRSPVKVIFNTSEEARTYRDFYDQIDYLLVPSLWEGGPIAVAEALACGVPVIAADVGWVPEMLTVGWDSGSQIPVTGCRTFPAGDAQVLQAHVRALVDERIERRRQVEGMTWSSYVQKLEAFVGTLKTQREREVVIQDGGPR